MGKFEKKNLSLLSRFINTIKSNGKAISAALMIFLVYSLLRKSNHHQLEPARNANRDIDLTIVTVPTEISLKYGYERFQRSVRVNEIPIKILGNGVLKMPSGQELLLLRDEAEKYKDVPNKILAYIDGTLSIVNTDVRELTERFESFKAGIVFAATAECLPDGQKENEYPPLEGKSKRFLYGKMFIGYADKIYQMLNSEPIDINEYPQSYYTKIYLNKKQREEYRIKLDHRSEIFEILDSRFNRIQILTNNEGHPYMLDSVERTKPLMVHAPGYCSHLIDVIGNYIPKKYHPELGCTHCLEDTIDLSKKSPEEYPLVVIGLFLSASSTLTKFLEMMYSLNYPKKRIHLFIDSKDESQAAIIKSFIQVYGAEYQSVQLVKEYEATDRQRKESGLDECVEKKCDFYFHLENSVFFENLDALRLLVEQNRKVLAPHLTGDDQLEKNSKDLGVFGHFCTDKVNVIKKFDQ